MGSIHNNLCMESIFYSHGYYLLIHPFFMDSDAINLRKAAAGRKHYSSPELWDLFVECTSEHEIGEIQSYLDVTQSDVYSLGLILIELAAMDEAASFHEPDSEAVENRLAILKSKFSQSLYFTVESMLAKDQIRVEPNWLVKRSRENIERLSVSQKKPCKSVSGATATNPHLIYRKSSQIDKDDGSRIPADGEDNNQESENVTENASQDGIVEKKYGTDCEQEAQLYNIQTSSHARSESGARQRPRCEPADSPLTTRSQINNIDMLRRNRGGKLVPEDKILPFIAELYSGHPSETQLSISKYDLSPNQSNLQEFSSLKTKSFHVKPLNITREFPNSLHYSESQSHTSTLQPVLAKAKEDALDSPDTVQPTPKHSIIISPTKASNIDNRDTERDKVIAASPKLQAARVSAKIINSDIDMNIKRYLIKDGQRILLEDGLPLDEAVNRIIPSALPRIVSSREIRPNGYSSVTETFKHQEFEQNRISTTSICQASTKTYQHLSLEKNTAPIYFPVQPTPTPSPYQAILQPLNAPGTYITTNSLYRQMEYRAPDPHRQTINSLTGQISQTAVSRDVVRSPEKKIHSLAALSARGSPKIKADTYMSADVRVESTSEIPAERKLTEADSEWSFGEDGLQVRKGEEILDPYGQAKKNRSIERIRIDDEGLFPQFLLEYNRNHNDHEEPINKPDRIHSCHKCHMKQIRTGNSDAHCKFHKAQPAKKVAQKKNTKKKIKSAKKLKSISPLTSPRSRKSSALSRDIEPFSVGTRRSNRTLALYEQDICPRYYDSIMPSRTHHDPMFYEKLQEVQRLAEKNKKRLAREQKMYEDHKLNEYAKRQLDIWQKRHRNEDAYERYTNSKNQRDWQ